MLYKKYQGGLCRVFGEATHTETEEEVVVYIEVETGLLRTCPMHLFYGTMDVPRPEGKGTLTVPRFREIDESLIQ